MDVVCVLRVLCRHMRLRQVIASPRLGWSENSIAGIFVFVVLKKLKELLICHIGQVLIGHAEIDRILDSGVVRIGPLACGRSIIV